MSDINGIVKNLNIEDRKNVALTFRFLKERKLYGTLMQTTSIEQLQEALDISKTFSDYPDEVKTLIRYGFWTFSKELKHEAEYYSFQNWALKHKSLLVKRYKNCYR